MNTFDDIKAGDRVLIRLPDAPGGTVTVVAKRVMVSMDENARSWETDRHGATIMRWNFVRIVASEGG